MNSSQIRDFIDQGYIKIDTELSAKYRGIDIGGVPLAPMVGSFIVKEIDKSSSDVQFRCSSTVDGSPRMIHGKDVLSIDGMDPARLIVSGF